MVTHTQQTHVYTCVRVARLLLFVVAPLSLSLSLCVLRVAAFVLLTRMASRGANFSRFNVRNFFMRLLRIDLPMAVRCEGRVEWAGLVCVAYRCNGVRQGKGVRAAVGAANRVTNPIRSTERKRTTTKTNKTTTRTEETTPHEDEEI